jgi:hypothetical protein
MATEQRSTGAVGCCSCVAEKNIQRLAGDLRRMASESIRRLAKVRSPIDRHASDMPPWLPADPCEQAFLPRAPLAEASPPHQTF